ncbi:hypothetical protein Pcinc_020745 [Petrolisthes cinctipes]|uniref:Uncharacterized protein n=1 Tax=Petrolisthes cinctipes TaxID=88211 RepID=A0AAE1FHC5_PETCI|nr:hypothetical protein Pcinc_020745 [Petrolisthes cinctipes]
MSTRKELTLYSRHFNPILRLFTRGEASVGASANQKMYEKDDTHCSQHKYCMTGHLWTPEGARTPKEVMRGCLRLLWEMMGHQGQRGFSWERRVS